MPNQLTRCRVDGTTPVYPFPVLHDTATGDDAVLTLAAVTDKCWCIGNFGLLFSYADGTFGLGGLTIEISADGSSWLPRITHGIAAAGLGPVPFHKVLKFPPSYHVRITLLNGGTGVVGELSLIDYWNESDTDPVE